MKVEVEVEVEVSGGGQGMCRARQPWAWKKCAIARVEVVNVGMDAEGSCDGSSSEGMRMYGMLRVGVLGVGVWRWLRSRVGLVWSLEVEVGDVGE